MRQRDTPLLKFGAFALVMVVLSGFLVLVFGQYRTGSTNGYSAEFTDSSGLRSGDSVRVAGVEVGRVKGVTLRPDQRVVVTFDADRDIVLTGGTKAAIRYLNLVGDRYLELTDGPGSTATLRPGARIPLERTTPALDLDLLLGGLKPVLQGLNAQEVNSLTWSLVQIVQGQEGTVDSLLTKTASFSSRLADTSDVVGKLIDNLNQVMETLASNGTQFSDAIDRLEQLVTQLSQDRDPIGSAIDALDRGTASVADLLTQSRAPLADTVDQLARLAPAVDDGKDKVDYALQRAPENFRKMVRTGSYGNFIQYFVCALTIRVSDQSGQVVQLPWIKTETGRCAP
ncbi:phospholipid/cholesterol/gamma-HCH transport system substrate-binding protein [Nocardia kruczakiae]|uniref:Phospholipid/cholesterol/gamma-HCH transport system substrate-binding protein n=1 Tax=Nocardia kruczakiae TaxID=261477 RepID=A0ABU1XMV1_9NOCA|nr:MCE family protein [Nocardia kruczakiae]MDR7171890.1 phospholipid/cholesterol/gamma-HCH transport system substrate-binding protein [Nocardia kruczakiae]